MWNYGRFICIYLPPFQTSKWCSGRYEKQKTPDGRFYDFNDCLFTYLLCNSKCPGYFIISWSSRSCLRNFQYCQSCTGKRKCPGRAYGRGNQLLWPDVCGKYGHWTKSWNLAFGTGGISGLHVGRDSYAGNCQCGVRAVSIYMPGGNRFKKGFHKSKIRERFLSAAHCRKKSYRTIRNQCFFYYDEWSGEHFSGCVCCGAGNWKCTDALYSKCDCSLGDTNCAGEKIKQWNIGNEFISSIYLRSGHSFDNQ